MIFIAAIVGYLMGSIPFGLLLTRAAGLGDIRAIGSGNIGATNVLRTGNKKLAALTLFLDGAKGAVAVALVYKIALLDPAPYKFSVLMAVAAIAPVIGHMFPVWLKFKGGKGVATALGVMLALAPLVGVIACAVWLFVAVVFRISSLAALVALLLTPLTAHFIYHDADLAAVCAFLALLVWLRHRANIKRLLTGQEPKIGKKKDVPPIAA